ncbi:MAG: hypothetical protein QW739_04320 [Candidatus Odinarchaeota archaeon]
MLDSNVSIEKNPLLKLLKQYSRKELTTAYKSLGFTGVKLRELLSAGVDHKRLPRLICLYLSLQRLLNFKNIFWENDWLLFTVKDKKASESIDLKQVEKPGLKDDDRVYLWVESPLKSEIFHLFNIEQMGVKSTVQDALKNILAVLDKKRFILLIRNGLKDAEKILREFKNSAFPFYKISFPAYIIKELVWSCNDVLTASISCSREISGTDGIDRIIFYGCNVGRGITELNRRHEIDLSRLGSWTEIQTSDFYLNVDGKIRFKDYNRLLEFVEGREKDLRYIKTI